MKTLAVFVARMGSSRLPGKTMKPILGKPMIERIVDRIRHSKKIDHILLATTELSEDDALQKWAENNDVLCYRGSKDDVLGRIHASVQAYPADLMVEVLGDNPLVHSDLLDDLIGFYQNNHFDYVANVTTEYPHAPDEVAKFPLGIRVQVYHPDVLDKCEQLATTPENREHATSYIYEHPEIFNLGYFEATGKWAEMCRPELTFAVNYQENFDLISKIFQQCYPENNNFDLQQVLHVFDVHPKWKCLMGIPS